MDYVALRTTFGERPSLKTIDASYLILDAMSPYNIIPGHTTINARGEIISSKYLTLKYPFLDGRVDTIRGYQQLARKSYMSILKIVGGEVALVDAHPSEVLNTDFKGCDPKLGTEAEHITPLEDLKEV